MLAVSFYQVVLSIHIMAVVVGFGVTFAYPIIRAVAGRMDPRAMPTLHRVQDQLGKRLITPGLAVVLVAGIYLASKLDVWSRFYVGWGLGAAIVLGALGGMFFSPNELRLAELAERDIAASGDGPVRWSPEYEALDRRVAAVGAGASLLILVTIYFMTARTGA